MFLKRYCSIMLASMLLLASLGIPVFAGDDTPVDPDPYEPVDESKYVPKVKLSSGSTVEITEGKTQEVIITVKNVGTGRADNFFVQILPKPTDPFTVSVETMGGSDTIQAGASKQLRLTVNADKGAAAGVYPVTLTYSYINSFRSNYSESDTLNIKVNNPLTSANIRLYNFVLEPASLRAGETGVLSFNYMNMGAADEHNVRISLEGLDAAAITVPDGLNSQDFPIVRTYTEEKTSFRVKAAPGLKNGSYPIKVTTTIKNREGEAMSEGLDYFINVGGAVSTGDPALDVINLSVPAKTYNVGENFTIGFELKNITDTDANNVLVKADATEENAIVPTSQSMILTRVLKAGETRGYSFSFAATSKASSQNYPISFTIEYDSEINETEGVPAKISFNQFFGVNVFNPEPPDEEKDPEAAKDENKPKIIVSSYQSDPIIVPAGSEFDLNMTFMNSHPDKLVKNIKVSLTVTDKDEKVGASIFSPVNASNTLYVDQIGPKQTVNRSIRYYAVPDASPQNYSINVGFEYEDVAGTKLEEHEIIGVNISQPPSIETSEINIPQFAEAGMPLYLSFEVFNTGKVKVNNLKAVLEGDMQADAGKTIWVGNFESGSSEYIEASFYYNEPGEYEGKIILSYDSTTGEHFEIPTEFTLYVSEPMPMDDGMMPETPPETGFSQLLNTYKAWIIAGVAALALIAGVLGYRFYKNKKNQSGDDFYE